MSNTAAQLKGSIDNLSREFALISHNLANVGTVGYKRRCNEFSKYMKAATEGPAVADGDEKNESEIYDLSQGNLIETGRGLDLALNGAGFFVIETPDGPLYTRKGVFVLNNDGQIVTTEGALAAGESGPVNIPPNVSASQISISSEGAIEANGLPLGKLQVVDFPEDRDKLISVGSSCFRMTGDAKPVPAEAEVKQGYQEASNVKMMEEMVDMIMVSRLYEANMRFITTNKDSGRSLIDVAMG